MSINSESNKSKNMEGAMLTLIDSMIKTSIIWVFAIVNYVSRG